MLPRYLPYQIFVEKQRQLTAQTYEEYLDAERKARALELALYTDKHP